ncbi:hypothetical protein RF11_14600 [Thelohanellus kitauei]|uniref:Transmembrane protein n=1 Tax=Thelohanellus kitauei TaxID=669202 RepID=A0A0C2J0X2_THEKT|nr:hypothetical protein RF11_14600 [Thelohanellus kitauei]
MGQFSLGKEFDIKIEVDYSYNEQRDQIRVDEFVYSVLDCNKNVNYKFKRTVPLYIHNTDSSNKCKIFKKQDFGIECVNQRQIKLKITHLYITCKFLTANQRLSTRIPSYIENKQFPKSDDMKSSTQGSNVKIQTSETTTPSKRSMGTEGLKSHTTASTQQPANSGSEKIENSIPSNLAGNQHKLRSGRNTLIVGLFLSGCTIIILVIFTIHNAIKRSKQKSNCPIKPQEIQRDIQKPMVYVIVD